MIHLTHIRSLGVILCHCKCILLPVTRISRYLKVNLFKDLFEVNRKGIKISHSPLGREKSCFGLSCP